MVKKLYDYLIKPLSVGKTVKEMARQGQVAFTSVSGVAARTVWLNGRDHLEGLNLSFTWGIHNGLGDWHASRQLHVHPVDEVLVFAGTDPSDIDFLGAEIQIDIGSEHERYIIDKPAAVVLPAGLGHNPIVTRWVDRPFGVLMMSLGASHETTYID